MREGHHHASASDHHAARDGRWICCPRVPQCLQEGQNRRLGSYALPRTQQKHQVPNDENLRIESKLIQVILYGERTKGKRSIWSETAISQEVTDFWLHPQPRTPEDKPVLLGLEVSSGPVWHSKSEVYQQEAAVDQTQMCLQAPKLCPQPISPAILQQSTC